ncbi:hypothetical protein PSACC_01585 [Paramicrosporidium saccamoebae]|uniref:DUF155 domain-containing protein n=1 Tax=Paramicrosporidium saccamoebae TaxID=1246581 RepID=A0A2H9TLJ0_9FUNG|nr:hypothetical protein PSACC_01585 [Paramicrosporidium saccamoebae]
MDRKCPNKEIKLKYSRDPVSHPTISLVTPDSSPGIYIPPYRTLIFAMLIRRVIAHSCKRLSVYGGPLCRVRLSTESRATQKETTGIAGQAPLRAGVGAKRTVIRRRIGAAPEKYTVVATCTAQAYNINRLGKYLTETLGKAACIQEDVWHVNLNGKIEAFFFGDGCFVLWGAQDDVASYSTKLRRELRPFELGSMSEVETEMLFYRQNVSEQFFAGMEGETIIVDIAESERLEGIRAKLAFSNGLADSVKLAVLENALEEHIERVKPIPLALASGKRLNVGRAEVLKLTGELLKFRADLNLHSELTDTPDMYWSEPQLEELYHRVARVLDLRHRGHILNKRLDYANELASVLRSHLSEEHGLKLEWGIIALIAVEVAFETLHWLVDP